MLQNMQVTAPSSSGADPSWSRMSSLLLAVVLGCVYILSANMSLALLTPDGVAVFWPAAGVSAGTLIAFGPQARWAVVAGTMAATIVANLLGDRNVLSSVAFAICNAVEAVIAAGIVDRFFGSPFNLDRLRHVLGFLGAAIVAAAVSGIGGTFAFALLHGTQGPVFATWQNWFASDALGIVTIAPLIIGLSSVARQPPAHGEAVQGFLALASLVAMSVLVVALPQAPWATAVPIAMLFPILLWIAARCPPVFAAAAAFVVTLAIVGTSTIGIGYFGKPGLPMAERVLAARAGILAVALCAYVLAALFAERRRHEIALAESEARVQEALTAGAVTTFVWDARMGSSQRSANAAQVLGLQAGQVFTSTDFLSRVHADDRERFQALVRGVRPERPDYTGIFRFNQPGGPEVWLEETAKGEFDGVGRLVRLKGLTVDVTARKQSQDQQTLLIAELDQRVRNLLARIAAIARDMRPYSSSLEEYVQALDLRIQSMADAHALLSRNRWHGADVADLVRRQLALCATDASAIVHGPDVTLTAATTQVLAMVLHELVTNAAKHGAISSPHGRVDVSWSSAGGNGMARLLMDWQETGGPAVAASPDCRYGVSIIRALIPRELGGSVDLRFASEGVRCKIELPLRHAGAAETSAQAQDDAKAATAILEAEKKAVEDIRAGRPAPYYLTPPEPSVASRGAGQEPA
jgi:two-component sensor histidine kinase/integral membrane sensor domain MASE1